MIKIFKNLEELSNSAAEAFVEASQKAVKEKDVFSVALSGGSTPEMTYSMLSKAPFRDQIPWDKVHIFWGDERCVALDDPRNNAKNAIEIWLKHVPILHSHIHRIISALAPEEAAELYENVLKDFFKGQNPKFDLVFLGLGSNGHTASLFPHTPVLKEESRWVREVYVEEQKMHRITLTVPFLNKSAHTVFLVSGAGKASALSEVLKGPFKPDELPAQLIRPINGILNWFVDEAAASKMLEMNNEKA